MSRDDGFLSRWSRRKQDAARAAPVAARPAESSAADIAAARTAEEARAAQAAADAAAREADEVREREAVLARLPKLEDLRADSDFSGFMHPLVPPPLRSAALARLWILDPAIRTYEDPARDYAWNWNVPGGAPGGGPPPTAEEVESTLKSLFKRFETEERVADLSAPPADMPATPEVPEVLEAHERPEAPASKPAEGEVSDGHAAPPAQVAASAPLSPAAVPPSPAVIAERREDPAPIGGASLSQAPDVAALATGFGPHAAEAALEPLRRRHGGAMPT
jgi:hypothetical protein